MAKRGFDILVSVCLLFVLAIPLAVIAIFVRAGDGGPAFYRQTRVGRSTQTFGMLKFRSMVVNADKVGSYMTAEGDPRITRIGRFLRRTSLDELPQLLNVLRGDMSLVGPRPDVPAQESLYRPEDWQKRHRVRPGITGLAQVRERSEATFASRLANDLEYVDRHSVWLDLRLLLATAKVATRSF